MPLATSYPYISSANAMLILRVSLAIFFMAHAVVRIVVGGVPQFGQFMSLKGFPYGVAWVWAITSYEIIAGTVMALGVAVRWMATGFIVIAVAGIILIHAKLGWFVGEHGIGGVEYSLCLIVSLLAVAAHDRDLYQNRNLNI